MTRTKRPTTFEASSFVQSAACYVKASALMLGLENRIRSRPCCKEQNMPRGNPHPVVRGRTKGVPNKFSVVRAERVEAAGKKLPPDEMLRNAEDCTAMARPR